MPKSQIIKDIVEDRVSLEQSLNRLYILARDVKNEPLAQWATKELNGYTTEDVLPDYRKERNLELKYSGINNRFQMTNQPVQNGWLPEEVIESLSDIQIREGIHSVYDFAASSMTVTRDLSYLAGTIYRATNGGVQCLSIQQIIPNVLFQKVCDTVKHKMIEALLELEKKYGCLDELGIDVSDKKPYQLEVDNAELNRTVLNINVPAPEKTKEKISSKIAWNVVIPIIIAVIGTVVASIVIKYFGLA